MLQSVMATTSNAPPTSAATPRREAVSVKRAAELLDVHPKTVRRLIKGGKLQTFRVGRLIRIRRDVLADFARARHVD